MTLVPNTAMPPDNLNELKAMSLSLSQTIKNREAMVADAKDASKDIHAKQLAKYQSQKSEVDAIISSLTNPKK